MMTTILVMMVLQSQVTPTPAVEIRSSRRQQKQQKTAEAAKYYKMQGKQMKINSKTAADQQYEVEDGAKRQQNHL